MTPMPTKHEPLTDLDRQILDFEASWWKYAGAKERTITETFGWTPVRHYQVLNQLLDHPDAVAYAPLIVRRLQRLRTARRSQRAATRIPS